MGRGDVVDISQILNVASGTNPVSGGYVRVTTSGLIQVDVNGGGNGWVTLSSINSGGAVTVRYLAGGVTTNVSVARTAETQQLAISAANSNMMLVGAAVAATGLAAVPAAARGHADVGSECDERGVRVGNLARPEQATPAAQCSTRSLTGEIGRWLVGGACGQLHRPAATGNGLDSGSFADRAVVPNLPAEAQYGQDAAAQHFSAGNAYTAATVAMPSAEMLQTLLNGEAGQLRQSIEGRCQAGRRSGADFGWTR